ncbi:MAG: methyltransferase domain-containing protein [Chloroflexi bacterium]|nr:methyltransferase domain-containing protein [Chloroflexota bacterium]
MDLGCGEGRNALFLAENGLDVTAVDISARGIEKLNHLAHAQGLAMQTRVQDMRDYVFEEQFDLIISHGCLHFIERTDWESLLEQFKAHTKPGRYNVVAVFSDTIKPPDDLKAFCVGLFCEGELFKHYGDWITHVEKSYVLEDQHPGGAEHRHPINKVVAQKP